MKELGEQAVNLAQPLLRPLPLFVSLFPRCERGNGGGGGQLEAWAKSLDLCFVCLICSSGDAVLSDTRWVSTTPLTIDRCTTDVTVDINTIDQPLTGPHQTCLHIG